jgi:hypothetical protein
MPDTRTALLIIRAWVEAGSRAPLRATIRCSTDVSNGLGETTITVTDPEAAAAAVKAWLDEVVAEDHPANAGARTPAHS